MKKLITVLCLFSYTSIFASSAIDFNSGEYLQAIAKKDSSLVEKLGNERNITIISDEEYQAQLVKVTKQLDSMIRNGQSFNNSNEFDALVDKLWSIQSETASLDLANIAVNLSDVAVKILQQTIEE